MVGNTFIFSCYPYHMAFTYTALSTLCSNGSQKRYFKDVDTAPLLLHYKFVKECLQQGLLAEVSIPPISLCMSIKQKHKQAEVKFASFANQTPQPCGDGQKQSDP